ncbi:MAG: limonene-1,2-epoxide hydrolase [Deltaproteobacteria bacterium]|nr:limonene-1,2-epoxide hydrolase [Deltaproteobacteria bacterium]
MSIDTVRSLIEACNRRDTDAALALFAEDAVYHNMPIAPATGRTAIREMLEPFLNMASEVNWVVHHWAEGADGIVMTERTDRFLIHGKWLELPVAGVFEVRGKKIRAWRDYFDMAPLAPFISKT